CLFAIRLLSTPARIVLLLGTIAASFGFHTVKSGVGSILEGGLRFFEGPGGAFIDNNAYAVGCVMILPFFVAFAQNAPQRWMAWPAWLAVPFTIVTVISTFSRGGLLSLVAATLTFIFLQKRRSYLLIGAVAMLPLVPYLPLPAGYTERISTIGNYEEVGEGSALGRLHFWQVALDMAADRPLGVGLWNFESVYDRYDFSGGVYGSQRAVHNSHLQVLTETGWLGAVWWVGLLTLSMYLTFRAKRRTVQMKPDDAWFTRTVANALITSMSGFLVGGTFVSMAYNDLTWLTFAMVAGFDRVSRRLVVEKPAPAAELGAVRPPVPAFVPRMAARSR
ncbi:MAG: O-antigen ligase family protein, partial [Vicinamibacterales bacterium]